MLLKKMLKKLSSIYILIILSFSQSGAFASNFEFNIWVKKFKAQGMSEKEKYKLLEQAKKNEEAGVFSIVLECINELTAKLITNSIKIPTIGIGASMNCDGQILVTDDMLGLSGFYPKFVRKFADLNNIIEIGIEKYKKAVQNKKFPSKKNIY